MRQFILFVLSCCTLNVLAAQTEISNATVRQPLPGKTLSAGYFSIRNTGTNPIALLAVTSPQFDAVELHAHQMTDGMMQMVEVDKIAVAPGQSVHLQPGGLHLMLFGPTQPIQLGQQVPLQLRWSDGTMQSVSANVTRIPKQ
ncbi:copper chaperone PCu(A)C [Rheinheimera tilapiae]|uniref:Copper chaperone PCu(A)C n=1 Tax=Rheinheimera tilapiae TaxID=875043 RepID=A0ABV6B9T5_9GAMM